MPALPPARGPVARPTCRDPSSAKKEFLEYRRLRLLRWYGRLDCRATSCAEYCRGGSDASFFPHRSAFASLPIRLRSLCLLSRSLSFRCGFTPLCPLLSGSEVVLRLGPCFNWGSHTRTRAPFTVVEVAETVGHPSGHDQLRDNLPIDHHHRWPLRHSRSSRRSTSHRLPRQQLHHHLPPGIPLQDARCHLLSPRGLFLARRFRVGASFLASAVAVAASAAAADFAVTVA